MTQEQAGKLLVIAFFDTPAAAEVAARVLGQQASRRGRRGTVGLLVLDEQGRIASARLGGCRVGDEPGVGAVLGVIALAITGRVRPRTRG